MPEISDIKGGGDPLGDRLVGVQGGRTDAANGSNVGIAFNRVGKALGDVGALDGVAFEIERHARIGIVGPSGGGKSTLLQLTAGLLEQDVGSIEVEGETAAQRRLSRCAVMPQS